MPVVIDSAVTEKLRQLVIILVDDNYFATNAAAEKYVQAIYKFIRKIPGLAHRKAKNAELNNFFVSFKPNRRTTWFILFYIENGNYFIQDVFNNHGPEY